MSILSKIIPAVSAAKTYIIVAAVAAILGVVTVAYLHYNHVVNELALANKNNATLTTAVSLQKDTINAAVKTIGEWKDSQNKFNDSLKQMNDTNRKAEQAVRELNKTYAKHNLTELSLKHPSLLENDINSGTADSERLLSCTSEGRDCTDSTGPSDQTESAQPGTHSGTTRKMDSHN